MKNPRYDVYSFCTAAMLDGRNNRFFFPWEQMFFLMQIIFIVLPSNMAAVQNLYSHTISGIIKSECNSHETIFLDRWSQVWFHRILS